MNINEEFTYFNTSSPLKFSILSIENSERYCHKNLEILYVLSGDITINCRNMEYHLHEDDIILINIFDVHSVYGTKCEILSIQIDLSLLDPEVTNLFEKRFDCNSSIESDKSKFTSLKRLIALIVKSNINPDNNINLLNKSYIYKLLYLLTTYFNVEDTSNTNELLKNSERIKNILNYINENYDKHISLNDLSNTLYLSVPYVSKIFKDFIGISFSEYLLEIRLSHAIKDLSNPNNKIEYIAEKNGFSNTRSFVTAFKNKYNCIPSKYRKDMNSKHNPNKIHKNGLNYLNLHHSNSFYRLVNYLEDSDTNIQLEDNHYLTKIHEINPVDVSIKGTDLTHTFKELLCIDKAKHLFFDVNKYILSKIQKEIGFRYIRFHGLLDDDMMLYSEDEKGNPKLCFTLIDSILDYIESINLKPFIELSFMPKALAKDPTRTMFYISSIVSLPKDINKWIYLIKSLTKHLISRYGKTEVESWPFFLWNEPDVTMMFGFENRNDFFDFYKTTYNCIKEINPNIKFGSSPVFSNTLTGLNDWMDNFFDYTKNNNCIPDYINMHFYPMNLLGLDATTLSEKLHEKVENSLVYAENPDELRYTIECIKSRLKLKDIDPNKLYLIGWNSSISHTELLNDTVYKSTYIAKNLLENYDTLNSFGYWQISDFTEEVKMQNELFHGGQGLFTFNGIAKSHYNIYKMLNKLGDKLLDKGNGYFITKKEDSIQIILYNYQHYSKLYASGEMFDMTFKTRYTPFSNTNILKIILTLKELCDDSYELCETTVNKENGSSFDKWIDLGAYSIDTKEDIDYLNNISLPKIKKRIVYIENNSLTINAELMPHEVRLIEINRR